MTRARILLIIYAIVGYGATGLLLHAEKQAVATREDELQLQVITLRSQLSAALKAQAKCEADGSQASQQWQAAQAEGQALVKALAERGLMVDPQTNTIVAKPSAEKKD